MKKQFATSFSEAGIELIKSKCDILGISRNAFLETTAVLECLDKGNVLEEQMLDVLLEDLPSKSNCKVTKEFLELQKRLPRVVKQEIIKFLYKINLVKNVRFSALKQANFYINENNKDEFIFYYGIGNMKNMNIQDYIERLGISVNTYGINNADTKEYIFLGRMQQYKHASKYSTRFTELCEKLEVGNCDCIKVHYKNLNDVIEILKLF